MARTVFDALDTRDKLRGFRAQLAALPIDTTAILAAIDQSDLDQETLAGSVVFPPDAEQSRLIGYNEQTLAFSRRSGRFTPVLIEDPTAIVIETVAPPPPPPEGGGA